MSLRALRPFVVPTERPGHLRSHTAAIVGPGIADTLADTLIGDYGSWQTGAEHVKCHLAGRESHKVMISSSSGPAIKGVKARRLQHERRRRNGRLARSMSSAGGERRSNTLGIFSPVTDALVTALRHPLTPRRETTRARGGDKRKRRQEEEEAMG